MGDCVAGGWWATGWAGDVSIHIRLRVLHQVALTRVDGPAGGLFLQVGWEIELAVVGGPLDGSAMSSRVSVLCWSYTGGQAATFFLLVGVGELVDWVLGLFGRFGSVDWLVGRSSLFANHLFRRLSLSESSCWLSYGTVLPAGWIARCYV